MLLDIHFLIERAGVYKMTYFHLLVRERKMQKEKFMPMIIKRTPDVQEIMTQKCVRLNLIVLCK